VRTAGDKARRMSLLYSRFGGKMRWFFRTVLKGRNQQFGGTIKALEVHVQQHMPPRWLHGEIDRLGLEFGGQHKTKAKVRIAISGSSEPCNLRIPRRRIRGLRRCDGAKHAKKGYDQNNLGGSTSVAGTDSGTIRFSGKF